MKRFFSLVLIFGMLIASVSCDAEDIETTTESTTVETTTEPPVPVEIPSVNEAELKTGVYRSKTLSEADLPMVILTLDGEKFVLADDSDTVIHEGTYTLTDTCYTMTYENGAICTFVVQKDGSLKMTDDMLFGDFLTKADNVDIIFTFESDIPEGGEEEEKPTPIYTAATGTYKGSCKNGDLTYHYTAILEKNGVFVYSVTMQKGETETSGIYMSGSYAVNGNQFIFTDFDGNEIEGILTAEDTIRISLKVSDSSAATYEVTLCAEIYTIAAGSYEANYEKIHGMYGTVIYDYIARIGADGSFTYYVTYKLRGEEITGTFARGQYTVEGNKFTFTDSVGNVTEGRLVANNTLVISLLATSKTEDAPYEVMFKVEP